MKRKESKAAKLILNEKPPQDLSLGLFQDFSRDMSQDL